MADFGDIDRKMPIKVYSITVLGILISVLGVWQLGLFDSHQDLGNCILPEGLECLDYSVTPTGAVIFVRNAANAEVNIDSFSIDGCEPVDDIQLAADGRQRIAFKNCKDPGTKNREIKVSYAKGSVKTSGLGKITGTVP
jgi:hypothetical protein